MFARAVGADSTEVLSASHQRADRVEEASQVEGDPLLRDDWRPGIGTRDRGADSGRSETRPPQTREPNSIVGWLQLEPVVRYRVGSRFRVKLLMTYRIGEVTRINDDGSIDITYANGDCELNVYWSRNFTLLDRVEEREAAGSRYACMYVMHTV